MFRFDPKLLKEDEILGRTQNATVYAYSKYPQDDRWAVKHVHATDSETIGRHVGEIVLGFSIDHPSLLPIKGYHIEEQDQHKGWNIFMKMPRMQGTLADIMKTYRDHNDYMPKKQIIKYFYTLVCGLEYLHERKIAHRDIKLTNILFDKKGDIKLADIGIGKYIPDGEDMNFLTTKAGTQMYAAPEMTDQSMSVRKKDIYKADCWSLGLVILELCVFKHPIRKAPNDVIDFVGKELTNVEERYGSVLKNLIYCMIQRKPGQRKSMSEIKEILQNEFAEILGLAGLSNSVWNLHAMKWDLRRDWKKTIGFEAGKGLEIKALDVNKVDDKFVDYFMEDIKKKLKDRKLESMRSFKLNLENCSQITDQGVKKVIKSLESSFNDLHYLSLNFSNCHLIKDESLEKASDLFKTKLKQLEELSLDFERCKLITDKGVGGLFSSIGSNLNNIQNLSLNFKGCPQITDKWIFVISFYLPHLENLTDFSLNLKNCKSITNKGISNLGELVLPKLSNLNILSLDLSGCDEIENKGVQILAHCVEKYLSKLIFLSVSLLGCEKLRGNIDEELKVIFKSIVRYQVAFEKSQLEKDEIVGDLQPIAESEDEKNDET